MEKKAKIYYFSLTDERSNHWIVAKSVFFECGNYEDCRGIV